MIARLNIFIICIALMPVASFAQKDSTYYFNKDGKLIANKDSAEFYRVAKYSSNGLDFTFTEYRKDGTRVEASARGFVDNPRYNSYVNLYYKNGKPCEMHQYNNGSPTKTLRYHPNGTLVQTIIYKSEPGMPYMRMIYEADSAGNANILNGNGIRKEKAVFKNGEFSEKYEWQGAYKNGARDGLWKGSDEYGITFEELYERGKLISGKSIGADGKKHHYTIMFENATYDGEFGEVEKSIKAALKNQGDTARLKSNALHVLRLSYTVNNKGVLEDIYGYNATDLSPVLLDMKPIVIKANPAVLRGVQVKYHYPAARPIIPYALSKMTFTVPVNNNVIFNSH
jgi:hypothetical protein